MSMEYGPFAHPLIPWEEAYSNGLSEWELGVAARKRWLVSEKALPNEFTCSREACGDVLWRGGEARSKCFVCGRFGTRKNKYVYAASMYSGYSAYRGY